MQNIFISIQYFKCVNKFVVINCVVDSFVSISLETDIIIFFVLKKKIQIKTNITRRSEKLGCPKSLF